MKVSNIYLISLYIINYCSIILVIMEEIRNKEFRVFLEDYIKYSADRLMDRWRKKLIQLIKRAGLLSIDDIKLIVTTYNSKKKENIMNMDSISEDYYELLNDELIESNKNSIISEDQRRKYYLDVLWTRKEYNDYKKFIDEELEFIIELIKMTKKYNISHSMYSSTMHLDTILNELGVKSSTIGWLKTTCLSKGNDIDNWKVAIQWSKSSWMKKSVEMRKHPKHVMFIDQIPPIMHTLSKDIEFDMNAISNIHSTFPDVNVESDNYDHHECILVQDDQTNTHKLKQCHIPTIQSSHLMPEFLHSNFKFDVKQRKRSNSINQKSVGDDYELYLKPIILMRTYLANDGERFFYNKTTNTSNRYVLRKDKVRSAIEHLRNKLKMNQHLLIEKTKDVKQSKNKNSFKTEYNKKYRIWNEKQIAKKNEYSNKRITKFNQKMEIRDDAWIFRLISANNILKN